MYYCFLRLVVHYAQLPPKMNWQPSFKFLGSFRETWKAIKALLGIRFQSTFLSTDCHSSLNWNTRKLYKPVIRNSSYRRSSCNIVIPLSKLLIGDISIFSLTTVVPATKGESKYTMLTSSLEQWRKSLYVTQNYQQWLNRMR